MVKYEAAEGFYDDGLWHLFDTNKVFHVHAEFFNSTPDEETFENGTEACDLRLATV